MPSIYGNLRTDKQYKAATGLNKEQFETLFSEFDKLHNSKEGNPYSPQKTPVLADKREALFFVLHYLKTYPTLENLSLYFGFSIASASTRLDELLPILKAAFGRHAPLRTAFFKGQEEFDKAFEGVDDIIIDVTEVPVQRPSNQEEQKMVFGGKKNAHPQVARNHRHARPLPVLRLRISGKHA